MFKDKRFNLSILFSTLWHLLWISLIAIIVTPTVQPSNGYQEVDFLGPILEKTAFDLMVEEITPRAETLYAKSDSFTNAIYLKPRGPEREVLQTSIPDSALDPFRFILHDYFAGVKEVPVFVTHDFESKFQISPENRDNTAFVEGPAAAREVISKPEPVKLPRGLYGDTEEYRVRLKFFIFHNGIPYAVEPIVSSGYPEIDIQAIRFLKGWRFSPVSVIENDRSEWGIVDIRVKAK